MESPVTPLMKRSAPVATISAPRAMPVQADEGPGQPGTPATTVSAALSATLAMPAPAADENKIASRTGNKPFVRARKAPDPTSSPSSSEVTSPARTHAQSSKVLDQRLPLSQVRQGSAAVLLSSPSMPKRLHGQVVQVISLTGSRAQMVVHGANSLPPSESLLQFLMNMKHIGLQSTWYCAIPQHVATYLIELDKKEGKLHALNVKAFTSAERHILNAIFDCGANIFISSHTNVFDLLRKLSEPLLVSVCGDGVKVMCTHWGYVTMTVGNSRRKLVGYYCAYSTDTTIVPAGWWDTIPEGSNQLQYWFRGRNHTLELFQETSSGEATCLGSYAREVPGSADHSAEFKSDLVPAGGGASNMPSTQCPTLGLSYPTGLCRPS